MAESTLTTIWNKEPFNYGEQVGNAIYLHDVSNAIKRRQAMFRCVCGEKFIAQVYKVKTFETQSCGCLHKKATSLANSKHGLTDHKLYKVWKSMRARCNNPKVNQYEDYGGNGVKVCEEWKNDFMPFYKWAIENGWEEGLQLDKDIKGTGKLYSPENCCFVTPKQNSNKRKTSRRITYNGETKTVSEWADYFKISLKNLYQRMSRGWTFEKSINYGRN